MRMNRRKKATTEVLQRPAAEILYADELKRLAEADSNAARPGGWQLTPLSVLKFILGDAQLGTKPKFVGSRSFWNAVLLPWRRTED